jgi:hypothetical protein
MADAVWEELRGLFSKRIDSPDVEAFLARYPGHKVEKPSDGRQYVVARTHGFDLMFGLPDGSYSGGRTAHLRVLITVFLNSDAVPKYKAFTNLPLGLSFADGHDELVSKLGSPLRSWPREDGGYVSDQWQVDDLVVWAIYRDDTPGTQAIQLLSPDRA